MVNLRVEASEPIEVDYQRVVTAMSVEELKLASTRLEQVVGERSKENRLNNNQIVVQQLEARMEKDQGGDDEIRAAFSEGPEFDLFIKVKAKELHDAAWKKYHKEVLKRNLVWETWNNSLATIPVWKRRLRLIPREPVITKPTRPRPLGYYEEVAREESDVSEFLVSVAVTLGSQD